MPELDKNHIVVATNILYRNYPEDDTDGIRGNLALEMIGKATSLGVQIVAADGGSSPAFLSALEEHKDSGLIVVESEIEGRGPQRRLAFETAVQLPDKKVLVYTQPEKTSLVDYLAEITNPVLTDSAEIVIPSRNPELFREFYPDYMWKSESQVNATYNWIMRRAGLMTREQSFDWFFGALVFKNEPEIIDLFLKRYAVDGLIRSRIGATPNPELHSDGHYFPIIEALYRGKRVVGVEIPFVYPPTQKANEMSPEKIEAFIKRRKLDGAAYRLEAIHFLAYLKGNPKSQIRIF